MVGHDDKARLTSAAISDCGLAPLTLMPAVLGPPPPRSRFHPDVYPEAEVLLICNISPEYTMLEDGSTRPDITLSATNCEHKAREGHMILESEEVRETFHVTLTSALEDLAENGQVVPGHGGFLGAVSTVPVEGFEMATFSLWRPIPHHYLFIRMCGGPLMTRAERLALRRNHFLHATQPNWIKKWWELFGRHIDSDWDRDSPDSHDIGGGNVVFLMPPGGPLEVAVDEGNEEVMEAFNAGEILVDNFSSGDEETAVNVFCRSIIQRLGLRGCPAQARSKTRLCLVTTMVLLKN